jgi:hypothetical protein
MSIEKRLERRLFSEVKSRKGVALKFFPVSFTGVPDRILLLPGGKLLFAEVKDQGKEPSPRQKVVITQLRQLGFDVRVINSDESLNQLLNEL